MATNINIKEFKDIINWTIDSNLHQPILALGAPGVGKSEAVKQIIEERNNKGENWKLVDLRLAQMSEVEIAGLIFPTDDKKHTQWLLPNWFPKKTDQQRTILLLDELTSATKRVQVAAYQLVLDRRLGTSPEGILPDDTVIVALGNRADDNGVVVELAAPLANRFEIYEIDIDADVWIKEYAQVYVNPKTGKGVNPLVTTFIDSHRDKLHTQTEDAEDMVFASPRTWNRVSDILNSLPDGFNISKPRKKGDSDYELWNIANKKISASIGEYLKSEFIAACNFEEAAKIVKDVAEGRDAAVPTSEKEYLYVAQSLISIFNGEVKSDKIKAMNIYKNVQKYLPKIKKEYRNMIDLSMSRTAPDIVATAIREDASSLNDQIAANIDFENDMRELNGEARIDVDIDTDMFDIVAF